MFQTWEWKRFIPLALFFGGYTLLFLLWRWTFLYSLPFLLGLLTAIAVQPIIQFVQDKLHLPRKAAAGGVTALTLILVLATMALLCAYGIKELTAFLIRAAEGGFPAFSPPVRAFFQQAGEFFQRLHLQAGNWKELAEFLKSSAGLALTALNSLLGLLTSLPTLLAMLLTTAFSAFFIAKDFSRLQEFFFCLFPRHIIEQLKHGLKNSSGTGRRYLLSYTLIYFISFCEAFVILCILRLPYPLLTAALTCVADVLPVLGPGIVFTPLAVYQLLIGQYGRGLGLMVGWLVMTCVRQIVEPKLVASTAKMHPLAMVAAVYFSLAAKSVWVLLYTVGLFMLYAFLRSAHILPSLRAEKELDNEQPAEL